MDEHLRIAERNTALAEHLERASIVGWQTAAGARRTWRSHLADVLLVVAARLDPKLVAPCRAAPIAAPSATT